MDARQYQAATARFFADAVEAQMRANDSIYRGIGRAVLPEGVSRVGVEAGQVPVSSPQVEMHAEFTVEGSDVRAGNLEQFHELVNVVAEQNLAQLMPAFFAHLDHAVTAVGNSMSLGGRELTWDDLMDAQELVEWSENDLGWVQPPSTVAGADMERKLRALGDMSPEQRRRWVEINIRKQEGHVSRRRSRRLR